MKKVSTCIVVADHQHARFFRNDGPNKGIQSIDGLSFDTHLSRTSELMTDGTGRGVSSHDGRRHGMQARSDAHQQQGRAFIGEVASTITKQMDGSDYERLILIAPPRALGELRELLPPRVQAQVVGELAHDLTKATPEQILGHLGDYVAT